jgi:hypothetical protein
MVGPPFVQGVKGVATEPPPAETQDVREATGLSCLVAVSIPYGERLVQG